MICWSWASVSTASPFDARARARAGPSDHSPGRARIPRTARRASVRAGAADTPATPLNEGHHVELDSTRGRPVGRPRRRRRQDRPAAAPAPCHAAPASCRAGAGAGIAARVRGAVHARAGRRYRPRSAAGILRVGARHRAVARRALAARGAAPARAARRGAGHRRPARRTPAARTGGDSAADELPARRRAVGAGAGRARREGSAPGGRGAAPGQCCAAARRPADRRPAAGRCAARHRGPAPRDRPGRSQADLRRAGRFALGARRAAPVAARRGQGRRVHAPGRCGRRSTRSRATSPA